MRERENIVRESIARGKDVARDEKGVTRGEEDIHWTREGYQKKTSMVRRLVSGFVRDLLKHPTNILNDQLEVGEVGEVRVGGERLSPPQKAKDDEKHPVRSAAIEEIERKTLRKLCVSGRPCLTGGRLNGKPPLLNRCAELCRIDVVAARKVPGVFHENANLNGPVLRR